MDIKEKLKVLPKAPGVYFMKGSDGSIIYVGKSKNLKSRVSSYFQSSTFPSPKVERLVKNIADFEYTTLDTEFEAFLLECRMIKELKPYYNRKMKTPLSYTFIEIDRNGKYPKIKLALSSGEDDGNLYFGPYTSKNTAERAIEGIKDICRINCSNPSRRNSPCLNYSLGLCIGMCLDEKAELCRETFDKIIGLLKGSDLTILEKMKDKMEKASAAFDFETAARYRDYIDAVNALVNKGKVIEFTEGNKNILMVERLEDDTLKFFFIHGNKVKTSRIYNLKDIDIDTLKAELKTEIFTCFKDCRSSPHIHVSKEDIDESQIIFSYLKYNDCRYKVIPKAWLRSKGNQALDNALSRLLDPILCKHLTK